MLGRDEVLIDPQLLSPGIRDAMVCVTGAERSIGSTLPSDFGVVPARLILLDSSEPALYAIEQELRSLLPDGVVLHQFWVVLLIQSC